MDGKAITESAVAEMLKAGADACAVSLSRGERTELNVDAGAMSLLRSTADLGIWMTAYIGGRKGTSAINRIDPASVAAAGREAVEAAASARPDPANGIAPASPPASFSAGAAEADRAAMFDRMREFLGASAAGHPKIVLEQCILDFNAARSFFANSNGVSLEASDGIYSFQSMFTAKDGSRSSSFNGTGGSFRALDRPLISWGGGEELMRQSAEQLEPRPLDGKFEGIAVVTPHCLGEFLGALEYLYLADYGLISGTSPYKDSLGKEIASGLLTLRAEPRSGRIQAGRFWTGDGFIAKDCAIIEKGVLRNFYLSLYGSSKTGLPCSPSGGGCAVVEPGSTPLEGLIGGIDRGILLCRFSGGQPSENGDFSGVAKNSYLIEKGKLSRPLSETMVTGNLVRLLKDVDGVSCERVDFGSAVFPWIRAGGVTISGK